MRFPAQSVALLLSLSLTACIHLPFQKAQQKQIQQVAPPVEDTPPKAVQPPPEPLPPVVSVPKPVVTVDAAAEPEQKPKPSHRKPANKPADVATGDTPPANESASSGAAAAPSVSAIGQLSSGDPSDLSRKTMESITATERGLGGINRKLSDAEEKTAEHIREFLKQARVALSAGDMDGASTLAAKAKVLLAELSQ